MCAHELLSATLSALSVRVDIPVSLWRCWKCVSEHKVGGVVISPVFVHYLFNFFHDSRLHVLAEPKERLLSEPKQTKCVCVCVYVCVFVCNSNHYYYEWKAFIFTIHDSNKPQPSAEKKEQHSQSE